MPLTRLNLETLYLGYTRTLTSLEGAGLLAGSLRRLGLYACSNLTSLDELTALPDLETLEVGTLRHIRTLEFARALPALRLVDVFELANVESLWPLADHACLEFLMFGRIRDLDLDPLTRIRQLRLYLTGNYRWNRVPEAPPHLNDLPDDHPAVWAWRDLQLF